MQLAVLPALLVIGWFVLGAIGRVVFVFVVAGREIHGITGMPIAIPLIPPVKDTWLPFRPRLQSEGWCAAVSGAVRPGATEKAASGEGDAADATA